MKQNREELLKHLAASLKDAKEDGGAILLVGAGISVSAGIPPAQKLMKMAIENFPNYFTEEEQRLAQKDLNQLQYNDIMTKLSNVKRKELFKWFIEGNNKKGIEKAKLNFAHIAIAELLKQGYFSRILTVNFDPLLIHACYMVGMYPFPAIYDLGAMGKVNAELLYDPSIVYLNGQHVGFVQRNTTDQLKQHKDTLTQIVRSTGCNKTWVIAGYSGQNDPLMHALHELRPYNNWLYWLEYGSQILNEPTHHFLTNDEECKVIYNCDADETFMKLSSELGCRLNFIEKPHIELEKYLQEINFDSAKTNKDFFTDKINFFISLLKSPEYLKRLEQSNQIDTLFLTVDKFIDSKPSKTKKNLKYINSIYDEILFIDPSYYSALSGKFITNLYFMSNNKNLVSKETTNQLIELALLRIKKYPEIDEYFDLASAHYYLDNMAKFEKTLKHIKHNFLAEDIIQFAQNYALKSMVNSFPFQKWLTDLNNQVQNVCS
ncbi:hypothetical protein NRA63_13125 [Acinetobacter baumannii]|uniref:hypothetical protein n=1 Tax=Acinetobacter baumannii TaxID=470 RepID=UPI001D187188|nr:hypothetical protein [Acinetobacter baumannii]MDC4828872.1 hypothetical protein [Acinetobacter baumannii]MDC5586250.1 hypothetical protein [Acinetobacter baumannii]MDH2512425.1 hypothetical protein [Acinetobacter baumannii]MDH2543189.1 hypothetical protein [Acinetobacter baumannii]WNX71048.1 hypothetical protein RW078_02065 [Acinetobacter baumannii]